MFRPILMMIGALLVSGCVMNDTPVNTAPAKVSSKDQKTISTALAYSMKDPGSAQFREWRGYSLSNGDRVVCVQVNGKNGFGAYVGFTPYYFRLRGEETLSLQSDALAGIACADAAKNSLKIASQNGPMVN